MNKLSALIVFVLCLTLVVCDNSNTGSNSNNGGNTQGGSGSITTQNNTPSTSASHSGNSFNFTSGGSSKSSGGSGSSGSSGSKGYTGFTASVTSLTSFTTTAGTASSGSFEDGAFTFTLNVSTSAAATVSLYEITAFSDDIKVSQHGLQISVDGASMGYGLLITPSNVTVNVATLTVNVKASNIGLFYISTNDHYYGQVSSSLSGNSTVFSLLLNTSAVYFIASISQNSTVPCLYNTATQIDAGRTHKLQYDQGLNLTIFNGANTTISVALLANSTATPPPKCRSVGVFYNVSLGNQTDLNATLSYSFNSSLLTAQGISASSLRWAVLNEITQAWELLTSGYSIDTDEAVISQQVGHFSQWAVYSETTEVDTTVTTTTASSAVYLAPVVMAVAGILILV